MSYSNLTPIINARLRDYLDKSGKNFFALIKKYTSPVHIVFPDELRQNVNLYKKVYSQQLIKPKIYYALKSNKSRALLKEALEQSIGVEVSSYYELVKSLEIGFKGTDILASGPIKNTKYIKACFENQVLIAIDDPQELDVLSTLCKGRQQQVQFLIRINILNSRFGMARETVEDILSTIVRNESFVVRGFSYHIDNYSVSDRQKTLVETIQLTKLAKRFGHSQCDTISIGGGFTVNYVEENSWKVWELQNKEHEVTMYNNAYFPITYPYSSPVSKQEFLNAVLNFKPKIKFSKTVAEILRDNKISLAIEPGRSLIDQAGITIFAINGVKYGVSDHPIIVVDGNINSLSEQWFGSDFLVDPILIKKNKKVITNTSKEGYYIGGNLCLESDMLAKRAVAFEQIPESGDLIIYINTSGYQMDSNESTFSNLPIPKKVVARKIKHTWKVTDDDKE